MQTHRDDDHQEKLAKAWKELEVEAGRSMRERLSDITAGSPTEETIREWESYDVFVRELPERELDKPLDLVRISVGGQERGSRVAYCVFRGPIKEAKAVLRRALNALRDEP